MISGDNSDESSQIGMHLGSFEFKDESDFFGKQGPPIQENSKVYLQAAENMGSTLSQSFKPPEFSINPDDKVWLDPSSKVCFDIEQQIEVSRGSDSLADPESSEKASSTLLRKRSWDKQADSPCMAVRTGSRRKQKNTTKNIPKNFGKAIMFFITKNKSLIEELVEHEGLRFEEIIEEISCKTKNINTIANLRDLWADFKYARIMRVLSNQFLRKHSLNYIFNSKISNYNIHVKYRRRLQKAMEAPSDFKHMKEY